MAMIRYKALAALILGMLFAPLGASPATTANQTGWVYPPRPDRDTAVVFIHGFNGDPVATWTNEKTGAYFPKLVADDPEINADVYVFTYAAPSKWPIQLTTEKLIPNIAADLINTIVSEIIRGSSKKHVVLIGHSMGGLVAWSALAARRTDFVPTGKVPMLFTYATPGNGSDIAKVAQFLLKDPELRDMEDIEKNTFLLQLRLDWKNSTNLNKIHAYCAYEQLDTPAPGLGFAKARIVSKASATALCNQQAVGIWADHLNIVKPPRTSSAAYQKFKEAFLADRPKWPKPNY